MKQTLLWIFSLICLVSAKLFPSITSEYDPSSCSSLLWTPSVSLSYHSKNHSYALSLTSSRPQQLKRIFSQLQHLYQFTSSPISLLVLKEIDNYSSILKKIHRFLDKLLPPSTSSPLQGVSRISIYPMSHPLQKNILKQSYLRLLLSSSLYANPNEFFQMNLVLLPYEKVLYLSPHVRLLKPIDHLFHCSNIDLFYTNGLHHFFDRNFYLIKSGDVSLYDDMMTHLLSYSWTQISPLRPYQTAYQEFLTFYFLTLPSQSQSQIVEKSSSLRIRRLSSCLYNFQKFSRPQCVSEFYSQYLTLPPNTSSAAGVSPYILHTSSPWLTKQLQLDATRKSPGIALSSFSSQHFAHKPCLVDFWIIGARKSGTTALYTWLTEHPHVAPLNIRQEPSDGEIMIPLTPQNLRRYNRVFETALQSYLLSSSSNRSSDQLLIGDSWVGRFLNDDYRTISSVCLERNVKILVILRDPIERCVSQWKMRYRREVMERADKGKVKGTGKKMRKEWGGATGESEEWERERKGSVEEEMAENGFEINKILERELAEFLLHSQDMNSVFFSSSSSSVSGTISSSSSPPPLVPPPLNQWKGSENCIYEGLYATHLRRWLSYHGIDHLRVYFTADLERYPREVITDALEFIGVRDRDKGSDMDDISADQWKYDSLRHSKRFAPNRDATNATVSLSSDLRRRLEEVFRESNRELERLLGIKRVPWGY
jgi:hypothetical protein